MLECFNGLRKLLGLHVCGAKKIPGVGIVRVDFDDALKCIDRRLRFARILGQHPEAVPGVGILRILFQRIFQCSLSFINLLQVQVRDTHVQPRDRQFGIGLRGLLKLFQSLLEKLLVHVRDAEIIQARGLDRIRFRLGGKQAEGGEQGGNESSRDSRSHQRNLTTKDTKDHKGNRFRERSVFPS